ncbi:MAG: tetratricopeptide repeat protein [Spirochaetota bacterium]|nr:tetratricopeptide repeat protein [Spirochaetota bacterium]
MTTQKEIINIAKGLIGNKNYREAEGVLFEALEMNPSDPYIIGLLIDLYIKMERLDDAEKNVELILKGEPDSIYAIKRKGDILAKRGRYDDALTLFLDIIKRNDNDYFLIKRIARTYYLKNDLIKALEYAIIGRDKFPDRADIHYLLFQIYDNLSDLDRAEEAINRALQLDQNNKFYYSQKLSLRLRERNLGSSNIQELMDISDDENPHLLKLFADSLKGEGRFDEAVEIYKRLISIDGSEFNQRGLAYLYYRMKEYTRAFNIFISLSDPNFRDNIFLSTIIASAKSINDKKELIQRMLQLAEGSGQYANLWSRIKKLGKEIEDEENL